jgi:Nitrile hydratase beta subunit
MNGVHDMGGLQGMGPIRYEEHEPVFHAPWEGRVYAIDRSLRFIGKWNVDAWRHQIELLPPADYLEMTYYERWLRVNEQLAVKHGLVTPHELETGAPDPARRNRHRPSPLPLQFRYLVAVFPPASTPRLRRSSPLASASALAI